MTHAVFSDLMPSTVSIAQEAPADMAGREALLEAALGPARHRKTSARLRAGRLPTEGLAFTAHDGIHVVGTIRLWRSRARNLLKALWHGAHPFLTRDS